MIDSKKAVWYSKEQRKEICKWCREQGQDDCKKCGITQTEPRKKKEIMI